MGKGNSLQSLSGGALVTAAALLAAAVAEGRSADELDLLALFFTSFADNLALLAAQTGGGASGTTETMEIAGTV